MSIPDPKQLQCLKGHHSDVTCCDFAPNFTLVTGSSDKTIRIWDWLPGSGYNERQNSPLKAHKYQVTCVRVSPQGTMLASSSVDGTAILWNIHSLKKLYTMTQVNGDAIRVCRFSPDTAILVTAGDNGAVCIWDLIRRSLIKTIHEHEGTTQSLAFTPDSQYLVTACSLELIRIWYVQDLIDTTGDQVCVPAAKIDNALDMGVTCVDISKHIQFNENNPLVRQYRLATCGNTNEIKLWTITSTSSILKHKSNAINEVTLQYFATYEGHTSSVTCIRYTNVGNYLISSSLDKLVKIWDDSGNCVSTLEGHSRYVNSVAVTKDGQIIASGSTGSNDKTIVIWDVYGELTLDSELDRYCSITASNVESRLAENSDVNDDVKLLEKIDDVSDGAINACSFYQKNLLAIGSGDKLVRLFKVIGENNNNDNIEELSLSPFEGHTYSINSIDFSNNGKYLASCSLDGCTIIWNVEMGEKHVTLPKNVLAVKACRFALNDELLITAGDDEKAIIWNVETSSKLITLEGHLDSVPSACFSPDSSIVVTVSFNADFRIWSTFTGNCLYVKDDAHDLGIQFCDISHNMQPIPNSVNNDEDQCYLLATCGNDGLVKLWRINLPKLNDCLCLDRIDVKLWRTLKGHGGNVICVKFSPKIGEFLCSTATDRQARIWSVYSAECLFVLDHDSIVTSCSFNSDCSMLAVGCLDKTLWLWQLPQQMIFQTTVASKINCRTKPVVDWSVSDVARWLAEHDLNDIKNLDLDGKKLMMLTVEEICENLNLNDELSERLTREIHWLKRLETLESRGFNQQEVPYDFLCPITHEIMREPVTCSDGYTYEKRAIGEWFMSGKLTSPMTNEVLENTDYVCNAELRLRIWQFLDESEG